MKDIAESIHSRDNGPTISPKEASTTSRAPNTSPESTMQLTDDGQKISPRGTSISLPHIARKSTLPIMLVDTGQETSTTLPNIEDRSTHPDQLVDTGQETSTTLPNIEDRSTHPDQLVDNGQETSTTLPNIEDRSTHPDQLFDTGQDINPKDTSTRPPSIANKISMLPIESEQGTYSREVYTNAPLANTARASMAETPQQNMPPDPGTSRGADAEAEHLQMAAESTEIPLVSQPTQHIPNDGDTKGTSAPIPALTPRVTPAPIFMLDAGQLTKPNIEIQSTTKIAQGESSTSVSQALPNTEQEVSTDSENNDAAFNPHAGTEFTTPIPTIPNREQKLSTDDKKKVTVFLPHGSGESTLPFLKLEQGKNTYGRGERKTHW